MLKINTFSKKFIVNGLVAIAGYCGTTGIASACGCVTSRSISMSNDTVNVFATATMTISYLCQGEVTATITAPDQTQTSASNGVSTDSPQSAQDSYTIGSQDGTYTGVGTFYYDGTDSGMGQGYFSPAQTNKTITPFVQLVLTSWNGNFSSKVSGTATFTVRARTSTNCTGNVVMESGMTLPNGAQAFWTDTNTTTQDITHPFGAGETFNYQFAAATSSQNMASGTVTGSASIMSYPGTCQLLGPDSGSGNSATTSTMIPTT